MSEVGIRLDIISRCHHFEDRNSDGSGELDIFFIDDDDDGREMRTWTHFVRWLPSKSTRQILSGNYELLSTERDTVLRYRSLNAETYRQTYQPRKFTCCRPLLHIFTSRRTISIILSIPLLLVVGILSSGIPPSYSDVRDYERNLPQHNLSLAFPEGSEGLFLRFPDHLWGHGFNNILQET